jgi:hypothetical protein
MPHESVEDFVKSKFGSTELAQAAKQQQDLAYFTQSSIQENITQAYLDAWVEKKYTSDDMFLNYVKHVFRTDNFIGFFKFMRNPLPSAELINNRIKEPLERVFHSDDSFFKYNIRGEMFHDIPELESKKFNRDIFDTLLFRHNNIIVTTVIDINTPSRQIIDINNVIAIDSHDSVIHRIAYAAVFNDTNGYMYMDAAEYVFLDKDFEIIDRVPHDLGETPADFIAQSPFADEDAVRSSMFSHVRGDLEEFVFLRTLLKMTEPNGVIPVVTMLQSKTNKDGKDTKAQGKGEPMASNKMGSQQASITGDITPSTNLMQAGTILSVPTMLKDDGSIDTDIVQNYFNFFHMPIEPLDYVKNRIEDLKTDIIISLLGNFSEQDEEAKNRLQVGMSFVNKEDKLRSLSGELTRIKNLSDFKYLALWHGKDNVAVDGFFGSDFFLETQQELFELFEKAPNPVERKNILIKSTKNTYKFNAPEKNRQVLLYHLMPYCADIDFDKAIARNIDPITFEYQNRFNYWIGLFEAQFGDIWLFFEALEGENSTKILLINNLIINLIPTPKPLIDGTEPKNSNA